MVGIKIPTKFNREEKHENVFTFRNDEIGHLFMLTLKNYDRYKIRP